MSGWLSSRVVPVKGAPQRVYDSEPMYSQSVMSTLDATSLTTTKMLLAKTSTMEMMLRARTALRPRKMSVVASLGRMGWMMQNLETTHICGEEALYCTNNPK